MGWDEFTDLHPYFCEYMTEWVNEWINQLIDQSFKQSIWFRKYCTTGGIKYILLLLNSIQCCSCWRFAVSNMALLAYSVHFTNGPLSQPNTESKSVLLNKFLLHFVSVIMTPGMYSSQPGECRQYTASLVHQTQHFSSAHHVPSVILRQTSDDNHRVHGKWIAGLFPQGEFGLTSTEVKMEAMGESLMGEMYVRS